MINFLGVFTNNNKSKEMHNILSEDFAVAIDANHKR